MIWSVKFFIQIYVFEDWKMRMIVIFHGNKTFGG